MGDKFRVLQESESIIDKYETRLDLTLEGESLKGKHRSSKPLRNALDI